MAKNAVMISIRPKWCELIVNDEKTIEVRKNRPRLVKPFKCYIYCTSIKYMNLDEYVGLHQTTDGKIDQWHGKIIGEFICDQITDLREMSGEEFYQKSRMTYEDWRAYTDGAKGTIYGWNISELKIYDEPKELSAFGLKRPPQSWCYVEELRK